MGLAGRPVTIKVWYRFRDPSRTAAATERFGHDFTKKDPISDNWINVRWVDDETLLSLLDQARVRCE